MFEILYTVGVILLYFPPLLVWSSEGLIKKYQRHISYFTVYWPATFLTMVMIYLLPKSAFTFLFYLGVFLLFSYSISISMIPRHYQVTLPIYACFALSVLWEWPYQLAVTQNFDALIMSLFKALGIFLFFHRAYKLGWTPSFNYSRYVFSTLTIGFIISFIAMSKGAAPLFWVFHLYRIPWVVLLIMVIGKLYIKHSKYNESIKVGDSLTNE